MKKYPLYLIFCLSAFAAAAQEATEYGVRLMPAFVFVDQNQDTGSTLISSASRFGLQLGAYGLKPVNDWFSIRGEINYSLMGYISGVDTSLSGLSKVNYHYFGVSVMPNFQAGRVIAFQAGLAANYLLITPNDPSPVFSNGRPKGDIAIIGGIVLRYDLLEIQVRYQHSLFPFTPRGPYEAFFRTFGLGLGYYFK